MKTSLQTPNIGEQLASLRTVLLRQRVVIFAVFIALIYGYIILQINHASTAVPRPGDIASQAGGQQQHSPHIDPSLVQKIEQLKDNSVSVKALFDQARHNPFQ